MKVLLIVVGVALVALEVAYYRAKCEALYNHYEGGQDDESK